MGAEFWTSPRRTSLCWDMHHMSDMAGLMLLKNCMREVLIAYVGPEGYDRQGSFASKSILEPGFSAWFQISLAAVTANTATRANFAAIALSIISSFLAAGKGMVCMAPRLSFWWKGRNDPDRPWRFHNFWTNAIPFLLGLVLFPAM